LQTANNGLPGFFFEMMINPVLNVNNKFQRQAPTLLCLLLTAGLAGCGKNDIEVYRVSKESAPPQQANERPGQADASDALPRLHWKLPAGWKEVPPSEMRVASFSVAGDGGKTADVSVVPLPGTAGGDLGNVNRWRGMVGLSAITEEEMTRSAIPVQVAGVTAQLYDEAGINAASGDKSRILAAILRREGVAWFFKMSGDDDLVAVQKPVFIEFLKSVGFESPVAQAELPPSHPPIGGTAAPLLASGDSAGGSGKPNWQVPSGWQEVQAGPFLVAKFNVTGDNGAQAAVNISMSAGDGGGLAGNVNRWRRQLGLSDMPDAEVTKAVTSIDTSAGKATLIEMSGVDPKTNQKARLIGAVLPQPGQTWFYKLMGNESVVEREKNAFMKFVETAKY
jgi:hypothetical protein